MELLRREFPEHPIVADLKCMDGGYLEAEMVAKAGATHVVVMARAHPATIKMAVKAGHDYDLQVMADDLACEDKPAAARAMEDLGVDIIVHHIGYDERHDPAVIEAHEGRVPGPLDELGAVVRAVTIPVQAVGGLSVEQMLELPQYGQDKLGEDADLPRTEIGKIERAETEPRLLTLMILADGLGVTLNDIVEGLPVPKERKPPPGRRDR